jgi:ubiquinone/menaquinone biosynthesis C-methylase UbiE
MIDPKQAATYERFRLPGSSFHTAKYNRIVRRISSKRQKTVLEVGSGTGIYTRFLLKDFKKVIATDIDPEMVSEAKNRLKGAKVVLADARRLPFDNNSVDVVFGVSVLHHIKERNAVFREAARVLKPGGYAVFCEPNIWNPMTALTQLWYREPGLTKAMLRKYSRNANLKVIDLGTTLLRSPAICRITDNLPGWRIVERIAESVNMGVSAFVVAQK